MTSGRASKRKRQDRAQNAKEAKPSGWSSVGYSSAPASGLAVYDSRSVPYQDDSLLPLGPSERQSAVLPVVIYNKRHMRSLGTAFTLGNGMFVTATHVVEDAERLVARAGSLQWGLFYVGRDPSVSHEVQGTVLQISSTSRKPYHDLCLVQTLRPDFGNGVAFEVPFHTLSPAPVRPGVPTRALGYQRMTASVVEDLGDHEIVLRQQIQLFASQGPVKEVYPEGQVSYGTRTFPGMTIGTEHPHGLSGGPIFDGARGVVVGMVSYAGIGESYASLLGPLFGLNFVMPDASKSAPPTVPLLEAARLGGIHADATAQELRVDDLADGLETSYSAPNSESYWQRALRLKGERP